MTLATISFAFLTLRTVLPLTISPAVLGDLTRPATNRKPLALTVQLSLSTLAPSLLYAVQSVVKTGGDVESGDVGVEMAFNFHVESSRTASASFHRSLECGLGSSYVGLTESGTGAIKLECNCVQHFAWSNQRIQSRHYTTMMGWGLVTSKMVLFAMTHRRDSKKYSGTASKKNTVSRITPSCMKDATKKTPSGFVRDEKKPCQLLRNHMDTCLFLTRYNCFVNTDMAMDATLPWARDAMDVTCQGRGTHAAECDPKPHSSDRWKLPDTVLWGSAWKN